MLHILHLFHYVLCHLHVLLFCPILIRRKWSEVDMDTLKASHMLIALRWGAGEDADMLVADQVVWWQAWREVVVVSRWLVDSGNGAARDREAQNTLSPAYNYSPWCNLRYIQNRCILRR